MFQYHDTTHHPEKILSTSFLPSHFLCVGTIQEGNRQGKRRPFGDLQILKKADELSYLLYRPSSLPCEHLEEISDSVSCFSPCLYFLTSLCHLWQYDPCRHGHCYRNQLKCPRNCPLQTAENPSSREAE